jgi:hypothetical protein
MPGTLNVGGHDIITHSGDAGAGDVTVNVQNRLVLDSSGNVGIGTSSPQGDLDVRNGTNQTVIIGNIGGYAGGEYGRLMFKEASTELAYLQWNGTGNEFRLMNRVGILTFGTNNNEKIRIDSSGKMLLGTTDDTGVAGTGAKIKSNSVGSSTEAALVLEGTSGDFYAMRTIGNNMHLVSVASASNDYWSIRSTSANGIVIYEDGQIDLPEVYNDTVTSARDLYIQNGGKIGYVSSIRSSKTNIENLPSISWLYELTPVKFQYRTKDEDDNYTDEAEPEIQYGLIAEDVVEVNSDLVFGDETENGFELRGIQYSRLIAPMIKAIQEQKSIIEALTARIEALETN